MRNRTSRARIQSRSNEDFVTTAELAQRLGVTPRRINQMLAAHILPPLRAEDDLHDADLAEQRYRLYQAGDRGNWDGFLHGIGAEEAERLFKRAMRNNSTLADCRAASLAVQSPTAALRFFVACKQPESIRPMLIELHDRKEDDAIRAIMSRMAEILAVQHKTTPETIWAEWAKGE